MTATISDQPPASPAVGDIWWESDTGKSFVWFDDGNTMQWVTLSQAGPEGPPGAPGAEGKWVEMTQAAYDALAFKDPAILYIITG